MKDFKRRVFYIIFTVFVVMGVSAQVALKRVPITPAYTVPKNYRNTSSVSNTPGRNMTKLESVYGIKTKALLNPKHGRLSRGLAVEPLFDSGLVSTQTVFVDASYNNGVNGIDFVLLNKDTHAVMTIEVKSFGAHKQRHLDRKLAAQGTTEFNQYSVSEAIKETEKKIHKKTKYLSRGSKTQTAKEILAKEIASLKENLENLKIVLDKIDKGDYKRGIINIELNKNHGLDLKYIEIKDERPNAKSTGSMTDNLVLGDETLLKTYSSDEARTIFKDFGFNDADVDYILKIDSNSNKNTSNLNTTNHAMKKSRLIRKFEKQGLSSEEMIEEIYREQEKAAKGSLITSRVISGIFIGLSTIMEIKSIIDFVNGEIPQSEFVFNTISNGLAITTGIVGMVFEGLSFAGKIGKMVPAVFGYITAAVFLVVDISKEIWAFCHGQITQTQFAIGIAASVFATGVSIGVGSALLSNIGLFSAMGSAAGPVGTIVGAVVGVGVGIGAYFGVRAAGNAICNHFESLKESAHFNKHCDTIKSYYGLAA